MIYITSFTIDGEIYGTMYLNGVWVRDFEKLSPKSYQTIVQHQLDNGFMVKEKKTWKVLELSLDQRPYHEMNYILRYKKK